MRLYYVYTLCTQEPQLSPIAARNAVHCLRPLPHHWQYGNREGRSMHSMKVHYTLHTMSTVWISDSSYNTGTDWLKQMWHITGVTHTTHWPSTPQTQQERWLDVYIDHWKHSQMSCTEYTSCCYVAVSTVTCLPWYSLWQSFTEVSRPFIALVAIGIYS